MYHSIIHYEDWQTEEPHNWCSATLKVPSSLAKDWSSTPVCGKSKRSKFKTGLTTYYAKYFCNGRVGGVGQNFVQRKYSAVRFNVHVLLCNEERRNCPASCSWWFQSVKWGHTWTKWTNSILQLQQQLLWIKFPLSCIQTDTNMLVLLSQWCLGRLATCSASMDINNLNSDTSHCC